VHKTYDERSITAGCGTYGVIHVSAGSSGKSPCTGSSDGVALLAKTGAGPSGGDAVMPAITRAESPIWSQPVEVAAIPAILAGELNVELPMTKFRCDVLTSLKGVATEIRDGSGLTGRLLLAGEVAPELDEPEEIGSVRGVEAALPPGVEKYELLPSAMGEKGEAGRTADPRGGDNEPIAGELEQVGVATIIWAPCGVPELEGVGACARDVNLASSGAIWLLSSRSAARHVAICVGNMHKQHQLAIPQENRVTPREGKSYPSCKPRHETWSRGFCN